MLKVSNNDAIIIPAPAREQIIAYNVELRRFFLTLVTIPSRGTWPSN